MNDICISHPKDRLSWGIELLFYSEYFTFVWINALLIYVTGTNFLTDQFDEYLLADIHVIGKDIFVSASPIERFMKWESNPFLRNPNVILPNWLILYIDQFC